MNEWAQPPATVFRRPVYHVVSSLMFGGGQQVAIDLVERLRTEPGLHVRLVALGNRIASGFPPRSHEIHLRAYDGRYNRPGSLLRAALSVRRLLRASHVEIVHTHGWDCDVIVGLARIGLPVRQVVHQHILADWTSSSKFAHRVRRSLTRAALSRRTSWVTVSHAVKKSLEPLRWLRPADVKVFWNGVDLSRFQPPIVRAENHVPIIGVAARLAPMKGLEYLIEAVATLQHRGIDCELRIAGEGPLRNSLSALAESLGVSDRVSLLGKCREMCRFYKSLDVIALPSVSTEGLPLSILEAMATGLPVVSTRVSGIPEAVLDGETGILVSPRDARALADGLEPLLLSPDMRKRMGRAGRLRVESEFSFERMFMQVTELYSNLALFDPGEK